MPLRLLVLAAALGTLLCGCSLHPLGTNDITLSYQASGPPRPALTALVQGRLRAGQITADVARTADGVDVTVDRQESGTVDALLTWRGGLVVYDVLPRAPVTLDDATGLTLRSVKTEEGEERYYEGPEDAVARAARQATLPKGERVLIARVNDDTARTLVVRDPPRIDLTEAVAVAEADGRTLIVRLDAAGNTRVDEAARTLGDEPVAVVRDRSALYVGPLPKLPLLLPMGDDLAAYVTAREMASLVGSPPLPRLARTAAVAVPPDWPLAASALGIPFVLSLAWLFFVRRFDRAHPEPWWLVLATFFLGCLSVVPAAAAEIGWMRASEWLDPSLVTMGGQLLSIPLALPVFALVIGLSEEGSKFLATWSLPFHRKEFDEPVDGIIYGAASALGFAAVENVKYFAVGRLSPSLVVVRMFMSVPAHLFFGAIWGYALGRKLIVPKTRILGYLALAAVAHGAFDTFLSIDGLAPLALLLNLALATLFVLLLRQSLRHGVVTPAVARVDPMRRALYPVGSGGGFAASVVALYVLAALLFGWSAYAAATHQRVGLVFVLAMSSLVTLLGVAAYFMTATMPLDVVLDDYGVTFAGSARSWRNIRAVEPSPRGLHVRSAEGDLWIGPAGRGAIAPVARAIARKLGSVRVAA